MHGTLVLPARTLVSLLLGFQIRTRSVEPLEPGAEGDDDKGLVDVRLSIPYGHTFRRWTIAAAILSLLTCAVCFWNPRPRPNDPGRFLRAIAAVFAGVTGVALIVRFSRRQVICELTPDGISAPDDYGSSRTFLPWGFLVACEFVYDDWSAMCDHFVLRDLAGRPRFRSSGTWLTYVDAADRTRIMRALRSRFPEKSRLDSRTAPAHVPSASSALWDRELDH